MERKKIQRVIGILVVVALVIILLPLLFNKKHRVAQEQTVASIAPPLFPVIQEQVSQAVSVNPGQDTINSINSIKSPTESDLREPRELKDPPVVKYTKNENNENNVSKPAITTVTKKVNIAKKNSAKKNVLAKKASSYFASAKHIKSTASVKGGVYRIRHSLVPST